MKNILVSETVHKDLKIFCAELGVTLGAGIKTLMEINKRSIQQTAIGAGRQGGAETPDVGVSLDKIINLQGEPRASRGDTNPVPAAEAEQQKNHLIIMEL
jgi:hypothetical protein